MPTRKLLKNLDFWAIVVAVIALVVSVRSCMDVQQQLSLFRGQVRSYVQVVEASLPESLQNASFVKVRLRLKNLGQTAAVNVHGEMDYQVGSPDLLGEGNAATDLKFGAMGPGMERVVVLTSNRINRRDWPKPRPRGDAVYFFGTIWYTDDTTRETRKEDWCFRLPLLKPEDLARTEVEQCGTLTYRSKDGR